jgi:mono/diheme cytochrome c family protein
MRRTAASSSTAGFGAGALVAVALAVAALGAGCSADDAGPAVPVDPAVMYAQNCARCHGANGRGDAEIKKTLPVKDFSDPAFQATPSDLLARSIMAGKGQMPAFGASLSLPKIQSLSGYIKRLGRFGPDGAGIPSMARPTGTL